MIRLALSELRFEFVGFIALAGSITINAIWIALGVYFLTSVYSVSGQASLAAAQAGSSAILTQISVFMLLIGIGIPGALVLSGLGAMRVELMRSRFARLRLAGATPGQVARVVIGQAVILSLICGLVGAGLAVPLAQPGIDVLMNVTDIGVSVPVIINVWSVPLVLLLIMGTVTLGAWVPARRASRVSPIEALRDSASAPKRIGMARAILGGAFAILAVLLAARAVQERYNGTASALVVLFGCTVLVLLALLGPRLLPAIVRGWTGLVPARVFPSWYVARHSAAARMSTTTATIAPFLMAAGFLGVYLSAARTWAVATGAAESTSQLLFGQGVLLFAPTATIAVFGSLAAVAMSGGGRSREQALMRASGASPGVLLSQPVLEAAIYAGTAFVLAAVVSLASSVVYSANFWARGEQAFPQLELVPAGIVAATAFFGFLLSTGVPLLRDLRHSPGRQLGREL